MRLTDGYLHLHKKCQPQLIVCNVLTKSIIFQFYIDITIPEYQNKLHSIWLQAIFCGLHNKHEIQSFVSRKMLFVMKMLGIPAKDWFQRAKNVILIFQASYC